MEGVVIAVEELLCNEEDCDGFEITGADDEEGRLIELGLTND